MSHFLSLLQGGGDQSRGVIFETTSVRVWVQGKSRGDLRTFGIEDGGFETDQQPFAVGG